MVPLVDFRVDGDVGVLRIDRPPVNAISREMVEALSAALDRADASAARALVVACAGRTFVAGGDIAEFERPDFSVQPLNRVLTRR